MDVRRRWITAILLFLAVSVAGLGIRPLVVPDEPRYGIIPSEMLDGGNWLALRMDGFAYYEKPPLGYWMTAASMSAFGRNAFALRLPMAVSTAAVALVAAWIAVRITRRPEDGPPAFMVQATTLGPLVIGSVALLDPPFAAFVAISMGALFAACTSAGRSRGGWLALAGVAAGFAFLAKGLLAFAIPGVSALAFLAWERRWKDMLTMPWIPLGAAALTVAPFAWAIERANPGFWHYFIVIEHFRRAAHPDSNQHPEPWWHFLAVFPLGAMLWTLCWPHAWRGLRGALAWRSAVRFMACWIVPPIALLSLSSGKLPTYVLPLYAPVAVLVSLGLCRGRDTGRVVEDRGARFSRWVLRAAAVAAVAVAVLGAGTLGLPRLWDAGESWRFAMIGVALLAWAQLDAWSWRAPEGTAWLSRMALAPVPMLLCIPFLYPDALLGESKHPWPMLERHEAPLRSAAVVISASGPAHALCWATGRHDVLIAGWASEFDNELAIAAEAPRRLAWEAVADRVRAERGGAYPRSVAALLPSERIDALLAAPGVPAPAARETAGNLTFLLWR